MEEENRIKLIEVQIFANLDSLSEEHNKVEIETEFEFKENLIRKNIKELVEKFAEGLSDYLKEGEEE